MEPTAQGHVLVIEDRQSIADLERHYLERAGFRVSVSSTGEEALALITKDRPDVMVVDYRLPDMDGVQLLERIQGLGLSIPSVMVTGAGNEIIAASAMKHGAMDYIVKDEDTFPKLPDVCADVIRKANLAAENERLLKQLLSLNTNLNDANARLKTLSITDDLTGAFNRRYLIERLTQEWDRAKRYGTQVCFALFDLDLFKQINDTHGHLMGDRVLSQFAELLKGRLRRTDVLGRFGGEEFGVIFTNIPLDKALIACEDLRKTVAAHRFGNDEVSIDLTVSVGVAMLQGEMKMEELIDTADKAMYLSKDAGRNKASSIQTD
jgi:diguanylate cyclase (GGDEF)-like protein